MSDFLINDEGTLPTITSSMPPAVVGSCSCCGGRVVVPTFVIVGRTDTTPRCLDCGAVAAGAHGPVVQMVRPRRL